MWKRNTIHIGTIYLLHFGKGLLVQMEINYTNGFEFKQNYINEM